jgi:hypothetical protein
MDGLTLDTRTLLVAARAVGLAVAADDGRLVVKGPKGAAGLVRLIQERKADILAALTTAESSPATSPGISPARAVAVPPALTRPDGPSGWGQPPSDRWWRNVVALWPVEWRARFGRRVDELQDRGDAWDAAEWAAFHEVMRDLVEAERRGEIPDSAYPDADAVGLSDTEAVAAIVGAVADPMPPRPSGQGPRDVRRGDRWLPWHFTPEFEARMRGDHDRAGRQAGPTAPRETTP